MTEEQKKRAAVIEEMRGNYLNGLIKWEVFSEYLRLEYAREDCIYIPSQK